MKAFIHAEMKFKTGNYFFDHFFRASDHLFRTDNPYLWYGLYLSDVTDHAKIR